MGTYSHIELTRSHTVLPPDPLFLLVLYHLPDLSISVSVAFPHQFCSSKLYLCIEIQIILYLSLYSNPHDYLFCLPHSLYQPVCVATKRNDKNIIVKVNFFLFLSLSLSTPSLFTFLLCRFPSPFDPSLSPIHTSPHKAQYPSAFSYIIWFLSHIFNLIHTNLVQKMYRILAACKKSICEARGGEDACTNPLIVSSAESSIQLFCKLCHSDDTCGTYDVSDPSLVFQICTGRHTSGTLRSPLCFPLLECKIFHSGRICKCVIGHRPSSPYICMYI